MTDSRRTAPPATESPVETAPSLALEDLVPDLSRAEDEHADSLPAMRTARIVEVRGDHALVVCRGSSKVMEADVDPEVEPELVEECRRAGSAVLIEHARGQRPVVVGVVQTRLPREERVPPEDLHLEAEREILLKVGQAGIRLRSDGEIEVVGSRISAASRGLFRIVGRILRLN